VIHNGRNASLTPSQEGASWPALPADATETMSLEVSNGH
jgi:hypothetical protein